MDFRFAIRVPLALMLAVAPPVAGQEAASAGHAKKQRASIIADPPPTWLRRDAFRASDLLGAPVRDDWGRRVGDVEDVIVGDDGKVHKVVAEVGGFLEVGDQHIGVSWQDVHLGPDMRWVQLPLQEVEEDRYSLGGPAPQGEHIAMADTAWRVNDIMGKYVFTKGNDQHALVWDVIFSREGQLRAVVLRRGGEYVGPGWAYVHPYAGYRPGRYAYEPPEPRNTPRFEYVQLGELSRFADKRHETGGIEGRER